MSTRGPRVLLVSQVEARLAADDADADRGQEIVERQSA